MELCEGLPYQIPHHRSVSHIHFIKGQSQTFCGPTPRQDRSSQHRLSAIHVLLQLLLLLNLRLGIFLRPLDQLIFTFGAPVHQRPLEELLHVLPPDLAGSCAQKPSADVVLRMRGFVPALPEQRFPVFLVEQCWMLC